jgi:hypothetical protein
MAATGGQFIVGERMLALESQSDGFGPFFFLGNKSA